MAGTTNYGVADILADGSNDSIGTSETDIVSVTDKSYLAYSQLTIYASVTLNSHTTIDLRVYYRDEVDGTWHQVPKVNASTGVVEDDYYRFNSSSPSPVTLDLPISSAFAVKVTAQGTGGASNGDVTVALLGRSN